MPLVDIYGNAWDHAQTAIPAQKKPELWFRPNGGHGNAGLLAGVEQKASLDPVSGYFRVAVFSDLTSNIRYRPFLRWLENPEEANPELWAFGYFEWPFEIIPDHGGDISDLLADLLGLGMVYCAPDAPNSGKRSQLHFNTTTNDLYERVITW